jgi:hypothetical protein
MGAGVSIFKPRLKIIAISKKILSRKIYHTPSPCNLHRPGFLTANVFQWKPYVCSRNITVLIPENSRKIRFTSKKDLMLFAAGV